MRPLARSFVLSILCGAALGCGGFDAIAPLATAPEATAPDASRTASATEGSVSTSSRTSFRSAIGRLSSTVLGGCSGSADSKGTVGTVAAQFIGNDLIRVTVQLTGRSPDTNYTVNVSCSGDIGALQTDRAGNGATTILTRPSGWMNGYTPIAFAIDVHQSAPICGIFPDPARTPGLSLTLP